MFTLVGQQNFYLGCRVCRQLLVKSNSVFLFDTIPNLEINYADAFQNCTDMTVSKTDGLPQRLCSGCAAKLTIAHQFKKDAADSAEVLKSYSDMEKNENDQYESSKIDDEDYYEYENIEALEDHSQDEHRGVFEEVNLVDCETGGDDAVSFLAGILKPKPDKIVKSESKKLSPKRPNVNDLGFDDPNRKHCCNVCSKKFQKRSNLIDHLRLHANVKVFSCEFCEKSFVQAGNYRAHLRTHTKEKPYTCHYCNKAYSQSSSLKIHIRSHTHEKNYVCPTCEKAFTNASDLGKHRLIHEAVKKFKCEECQRHFTQKIHLRKHLEKHHPDIDFEMLKDTSDNLIKVEDLVDGTKVIFEEFEIIEDTSDSKPGESQCEVSDQ